MATASTTKKLGLDPGDLEILHKFFRDKAEKDTVFDLTTVEDMEFGLHIEADGFHNRVLYFGKLLLPSYRATLEIDGFRYEGWFAFSKTQEEIFGRIPHCGTRRSGRLKLCHERL